MLVRPPKWVRPLMPVRRPTLVGPLILAPRPVPAGAMVAVADVAVVPMWGAGGRVGRGRRVRSSAVVIESLYTELAPRVLGYLRAHGAPDPEDLLGEVFYQVARDYEQFSGSRGDRRRWVFGIARNRLIDAHRRRAVRPTVVDEPVPEVPADELADELVDPELVAALAGLTDEQREVLVLRFVADLPTRDVARLTGREVGATKALQRRGLAALARALQVDAHEALITAD
jgi:RNA polymerase sigma factor (sigma-70 family)